MNEVNLEKVVTNHSFIGAAKVVFEDGQESKTFELEGSYAEQTELLAVLMQAIADKQGIDVVEFAQIAHDQIKFMKKLGVKIG